MDQDEGEVKVVDSLAKYLGYAVVLILAGYFGYYLHGTDPPIVETQIVYRDRDIHHTDTVTVNRPVTRYVYKTVTDTVEKRIYIPAGFNMAGVISSTPIKISGPNVTLTWFSPDSLRWFQDVHEVSRPRWGLALDLRADVMPGHMLTSLGASVRYRAITGRVGAGVLGTGEYGLVFGATVGLFRWEL